MVVENNVKLAESNTNIATVLLNTHTLKVIQQNKNIYIVTKISNKILMKN